MSNKIRSLNNDQSAHMQAFLAGARTHEPREPAADATDEEYQAYVDRVTKGPLADMPLLFDANRYFDTLDRIAMEDGWVLDYVYHTDIGSASPILYARRNSDPRLAGIDAFEEKFGKLALPIDVNATCFHHVQADGTDESFLQLVLLRVMGGQFYLYWHANYDDTRILWKRSELLRLTLSCGLEGHLPLVPLARSLLVPWSPDVSFTEDEVTVCVLIFSKWSGFSRYTVKMSRSFPHVIITEYREVIAPYDIGIRF